MPDTVLASAISEADPAVVSHSAFYLLSENPASDYAIIDYRMHHGSLPLGSVAVVVLASWPVWLVLIALLLWVFPDGRLPHGRWRRVAVVLA